MALTLRCTSNPYLTKPNFEFQHEITRQYKGELGVMWIHQPGLKIVDQSGCKCYCNLLFFVRLQARPLETEGVT